MRKSEIENHSDDAPAILHFGADKSSFFTPLRVRFILAGSTFLGSSALLCLPAFANTANAYKMSDLASLSAVVGSLAFALVASWLHRKELGRWKEQDTQYKKSLDALRIDKERLELFWDKTACVLLSFCSGQDEPQLEGDFSALIGRSSLRRPLPLSGWLPQHIADDTEHKLQQLRDFGQSFDSEVKTLWGEWVQIQGRPHQDKALVFIKKTSSAQALHAEDAHRTDLKISHTRQIQELFMQMHQPAWIRNPQGQLVAANKAYLLAIEKPQLEGLAAHESELFDTQTLDAFKDQKRKNIPFKLRASVIMGGARRTMDIFEMPIEDGWAGIAYDVSELIEIKNNLDHEIQANTRTLNQLTTAVVSFDAQGRMIFCNDAYQNLWPLEEHFLRDKPTESEILDRLRSKGKLPEQSDFRGWKAKFLEAYRSNETKQDWWHLPDRRALRVVSNPNTRGGVTYLFDDVTEHFSLESKLNSFARVQNETLHALSEGVAVIGLDGRLKLFNPAFADLWHFDESALKQQPHVDTLFGQAMRLYDDATVWDQVKQGILGGFDKRQPMRVRMERKDGMAVDCLVAPLPDGATLLTFIDVTDSVNAERLLQENNEALEKAAQIKNDFVHHVSYSLRSPLTNIIGFTQLLSDPAMGSLNDKQANYAQYILSSSSSLLSIINDILDLASIDEGAVVLEKQAIHIKTAIEETVAALRDRFQEASVSMEVRLPQNMEPVFADPKRLRQIIFNLVANAVEHSAAGQKVAVVIENSGTHWALHVQDQGAGIPQDVIERVFERFETANTSSMRRRGIGLGLTLVRTFVEMHGGRVSIVSEPTRGTRVTCQFPHAQESVRTDMRSPVGSAA